MRIALITEGTYPFVRGGVSVWCDRLIRALPDIEFDLYAVAGLPSENPAWTLPENVSVFETVAIETGPDPLFGRIPASVREEFLDALQLLVLGIVSPPAGDDGAFLAGLRGLYEAGRGFPVDAGIRSAEAFEVIRQGWVSRRPGEHLARLGPPSLHDVLEVSSALARYLAPLRAIRRGDVVHATANGIGSLMALTAGWDWNTPMLLTEHGVYLRERYLEQYEAPVPPRVRAFQLAFFRCLNNTLLETADLVAPVSEFNRRWERRTGGDPSKILTIHNGVDPEAFPVQMGEPAVPTISWVGRIDPLKDIKTLLEAFSLVRRPIPSARLRLFGPVPAGNEAYYRECVGMVERLRMESAVSFEGHLERVSFAHEAAHVVVLSSISEGFPFTVLEAMMSGRATVSTDVGGVSEAVGDAGLLVRPRDPEGLAGALVRTLTDHHLRQRLGRAARDRAMRLFTLERMTDLYRLAYRSVINRDVAPLTRAILTEPMPVVIGVSSDSSISEVGGRS